MLLGVMLQARHGTSLKSRRHSFVAFTRGIDDCLGAFFTAVRLSLVSLYATSPPPCIVTVRLSSPDAAVLACVLRLSSDLYLIAFLYKAQRWPSGLLTTSFASHHLSYKLPRPRLLFQVAILTLFLCPHISCPIQAGQEHRGRRGERP